MSADVIDLASRRRRVVGVDLASEPSYEVHVRPSTPEVPLVLVAQPGAVMVIGQCRDGDALELWLSPSRRARSPSGSWATHAGPGTTS